jgi:hypothetical protein
MARFDELCDQVAAERAGKHAVVIDLDPQASAAAWRDLRKDKGQPQRQHRTADPVITTGYRIPLAIGMWVTLEPHTWLTRSIASPPRREG